MKIFCLLAIYVITNNFFFFSSITPFVNISTSLSAVNLRYAIMFVLLNLMTIKNSICIKIAYISAIIATIHNITSVPIIFTEIPDNNCDDNKQMNKLNFNWYGHFCNQINLLTGRMKLSSLISAKLSLLKTRTFSFLYFFYRLLIYGCALNKLNDVKFKSNQTNQLKRIRMNNDF